MPGGRVLVTDSPRLIEPCAGPWDTLRALLHGLLADEHFDQTPYLFGWLKGALESLRAGRRRTGQALVIAGPSNCGKSLLQKLITELLGGRVAKPYQFMTARTPFNAHAITLNDEPENLMVLPPLDESIEDKLILLRARREGMPMPTESSEQRRAFWDQLISELPAFVGFLLGWDIPEKLLSARFGIREFHHPDLLQAVDDLAPERRLLDLIDAELFSGPMTEAWEGKAEQLEKELTGIGSDSAYEARRILNFSTACGVFLSRLAKKHPGRVSKRILEGSALWTIEPHKSGGGQEAVSHFLHEANK